MAKWLKRLFCRHVWALDDWHYTHGPMDNDPAFIQCRLKCLVCGKEHYVYPKRGGAYEEFLVNWTKSKRSESNAENVEEVLHEKDETLLNEEVE